MDLLSDQEAEATVPRGDRTSASCRYEVRDGASDRRAEGTLRGPHPGPPHGGVGDCMSPSLGGHGMHGGEQDQVSQSHGKHASSPHLAL